MVFEQNKTKDKHKKGIQGLQDHKLVRLARSKSKKKNKALEEIARRLRAGRRVGGIEGMEIPGFHERRFILPDSFKQVRMDNLKRHLS